jgi:rfaE bifunctional protein nucleotidyltransferase chain/domain
MNNLDNISSRILDSEMLSSKLEEWQEQGKKVVFTNGVFDIIHLGHVDYLSKAADLGDILMVGVNSDSSVKMLHKGDSRPINDEKSRSTIVASLNFVDAVVIFHEDTPYNLISKVEPDVLVKGSDYRPEDIVGYDIVTAKGGSIITIDFLPGYSTTLIEKKIKNS